MNAITNLYDSKAGITDATMFMAADADVKRAVIRAWTADNARHAATFRDSADAFFSDAQVGYAFLNPQLVRIEAEVYSIKRPSFDITRFMTVDSSGDMWDVGTLVYSQDSVGQAEFLSGGAFDMPYASKNMNQQVRGFHLAGIGYEWNTQEMERAAKLGRSLSADKADAAVQASDIFIYSIAMKGQTPRGENEKGWTGFVNAAEVPAAQVPADGTAGARTFASKTADQILRDLNEAITSVETQSGETMVADTVALPTSIYNTIATTRVGDSGSTILAFLQANNAAGEGLSIVKSRALETAGAGGSKRMVAYANNPQVVKFLLPGPHQFMPAFQKASMVYEVAGTMNVGGVDWRLPKGAVYRDGI